MATPDTALLAHIDTYTSLTTGTNLFSGPVRAAENNGYIPQACVFVMIMPGGSIMNYCQGGARTNELYESSCRVVVRSSVADYAGGLTTARAIRDAIHDLVPSGYISCRVRTAEPEYYGTDDAGSHLFGFDVDMLYSA